MNKYFKIANYIASIKNYVINYTKSYSQSGEDLILNNFFKYKKTGSYIDIGANDHKKFNNTYFFYSRGWRGINIEPNIKKHANLRKKRKEDINLNFGVGQKEGFMDFYEFKPDTLSTFSTKTAKEYEKMGHKITNRKKIMVFPLKDILDKYFKGTEIDFMTIDTEGNDLDVLKSNDWIKYRPTYLIIETLEYRIDNLARKNNKMFDDYLAEINYVPIIDTYINTVYYNKKHV
jgi:FkbM family methyltransferase